MHFYSEIFYYSTLLVRAYHYDSQTIRKIENKILKTFPSVLFIVVLSAILVGGWSSDCKAQFWDPSLAIPVTSFPTNGGNTFFSISGNFGPMPVDFFPSLNLYAMPGETNFFWIDDSSGGGFALDDPAFPGPGGGDTNDYTPDTSFNQASFIFSYTSNAWQYTNYWLSIASDATSNTQVTVVDTIPGLFYQLQTNSNLLSTNWVPWTNLLASTQNTPAPLLNLGTNQLFFRGKIVLPGGSLLTNGLVAYWKMNDATGTNAADSSGYGNPLSLSNAPYWGPGCLILDGTTQYGDAGRNTNTEIDYQSITICAWVNQSSNAAKGIVDKSYNIPFTGQDGWGLWTTGDGHTLFYGAGGNELIDNGPLTVTPGLWTFVTMVFHAYDGLGEDFHGYFFVNGIKNSDQYNENVVPTKTSGYADLMVGNLQNDRSNGLYCFNGSLRNVAVYNRALTDSEVHSNYLNTADNISVGTPDLLYYKMTEFNPADPTNHPFSLTDSSTHGGTTGTYEGIISTIWTNNPGGLADTALHFSGVGAYIDTSNSVLFNFTTNSFTINLWLNPYTGDGYVAGNNSYLSNGWFMSVNNDGYFYFGAETAGAETSLYTQSPIPGPLAWDMITVTRSGTNTPLVYINGALTAMSGSFVNPASSTNSLKFGVGVDGNGTYPLDGNIWQPQIWSTVLSPTDIGNLYQEQLSGAPWP